MKTCNTCNKELSFNHFRKHGRSNDGYGSKCIDCSKKSTNHLDTRLERKGEVWKELEGVPDAYVSNFGRVKSQTPHFGWKILKPQIYRRKDTRSPRLRVMIDRRTQGGKAHYIFLAQHVAKAFLGEPLKPKSKIIFRDNDPFNCSAFNLAWEEGFNTFADHLTLDSYSKMDTEMGIAAYKYCLQDKKPLELLFKKLEGMYTNRVTARFNLSQTEASEVYWQVVAKYLQKLPTGAYRDIGVQEALIGALVREYAKYASLKKFKSVSSTGYLDDGDEYNIIDNFCVSDLYGNKEYTEKYQHLG